METAAYVEGTMNNSAWQRHRVCAMETSLERKVGALLMRLLDARRGSSPLNLGHGEPLKVFELWSYARGKAQGEAHTSSHKGLSAGPSCSPSPSAPFPGSPLKPNPPTTHMQYSFPFGEGTDAGSPASFSAVYHLGSPSLLVSTYF